MEKTLAIIKPHAVKEGNANKIIDMIEDAGFDIVRMERITITREQAQDLYAEHSAKPFYAGMITRITASPVVVMVLSKPNAIKAWRDLMGATDPLKAEQGTVRALFGRSMDENATHGSDSLQSAARECDIFFPQKMKSCC